MRRWVGRSKRVCQPVSYMSLPPRSGRSRPCPCHWQPVPGLGRASHSNGIRSAWAERGWARARVIFELEQAAARRSLSLVAKR